MKKNFYLFLFIFIFNFNFYAFASSIDNNLSSIVNDDVNSVDDIDDVDSDLYENTDDYLINTNILETVRNIYDVLKSSPSDASDEVLSSSVPYIDDDFYRLTNNDNPFKNLSNCLIYNVSFGNKQAKFIFPLEYKDCLSVDSDNHLINVSSNNVVGRVFYDNHFDIFSDHGELVTLLPCLSSNFSTLRNNHSLTYLRKYYWDYSYNYGYSLHSSDVYIMPVVESFDYPFVSSDSLTYILIFFVGGLFILCFMRNFKHY